MSEESQPVPPYRYELWYPDVPPVMDTRQVGDLLGLDEQVVRIYIREGIIPAHRREGGRKYHVLRHEIFLWLEDIVFVPAVDEP